MDWDIRCDIERFMLFVVVIVVVGWRIVYLFIVINVVQVGNRQCIIIVEVCVVDVLIKFNCLYSFSFFLKLKILIFIYIYLFERIIFMENFGCYIYIQNVLRNDVVNMFKC